MKREGRQHGMVRSYRILPSPLNPRPNTRLVSQSNSPPTAGLFVKVSTKPNNHSKFTGKCTVARCTSCHLHPTCKSKNKTKATQKHKSKRVIDQPESRFSGLSATGMLEQLSNNVYMDDEVENEIGDDVDYDMNKNDGICISEIKFQLMDQVEEEKGEDDEDWFLVESCSHD